MQPKQKLDTLLAMELLMKLYTLMDLFWHIWNIETSFVKTTSNLLVWQVQIFFEKFGCTMPLPRFFFSKSKGLIIRAIQAGDTTAWHDWYLGRGPEEMECQTVMTGLSNGSLEPHGTSCFFLQVSAIAELHPLVVDFAEDPLGSRQVN